MEIHCTCHQLQSRSCYLFCDILLVYIEGTLSHTDAQFLYTGTKAFNPLPPVPSQGQLHRLTDWTDREDWRSWACYNSVFLTSNKDVEVEQARRRLWMAMVLISGNYKTYLTETKQKKNCRKTRYWTVLMAHNWQKWKRVFLPCPWHKMYKVEAVGLKSSNYTWKIMIFANMWNLRQFREKLIFCQ